ncbi:MAG: type IV pilin [Haloferacaceae archaeon]
MSTDRGASAVVGVALLVAVVVVVATVVSGYVLGVRSSVSSEAPAISVSERLVDDGGERTAAITFEAGESIRVDRVYVVGSKPVDVGGPPGSSTAANDDPGWTSKRESLAESSGDNPPQVAVGETWDSGETVYVDPQGNASGVTLSLYWNTQSVDGVNPGTVRGENSYKIAEFTL